MIVAVASGKGGAGKTTVAAALVETWTEPVMAVDLDVEEPNLHLFLQPDIEQEQKVFMETPVLEHGRCSQCGQCADLCQFKAITMLGKMVMTFPDMCHGCGGCLAICPEDALHPGKRELGEVCQGKIGAVSFLMGRLRVGEAMSPPLMQEIIRQVRSENDRDAIFDAPPGVSCPAITAVRDSDVIVLVGDGTPFGFHDFCLAWEAFSPLGNPMGVVLNRVGLGDARLELFCEDHGLPVIGRIPFDRRIAEAYAGGSLLTTVSPELAQEVRIMQERIKALGGAADA